MPKARTMEREKPRDVATLADAHGLLGAWIVASESTGKRVPNNAATRLPDSPATRVAQANDRRPGQWGPARSRRNR